nr:hypothetical protein [Tanacetum cinerariifolium]
MLFLMLHQVLLRLLSVDVKNKGVYSIVETKPVKKNNFSPSIIKDWNFNDESEVECEPKVKIKTVRPCIKKIKFVKTAREKVEKEKDSLSAQEDASKQGRSIKDINQDAEIVLVDEAQGRMHDTDMFGVDELEGNEVIVDVREKIVEKEVSTADPVTTAGEVVTAASVEDSDAPNTTTTADVDDELTLEKTLISIKAAKPKVISTPITTPRAKGIFFHEQVQVHIPTISLSKDKGKAKMIKIKKPLKKKDQITLNEEVARKLEAGMRVKMEKEERMVREKDKANRAVIEE